MKFKELLPQTYSTYEETLWNYLESCGVCDIEEYVNNIHETDCSLAYKNMERVTGIFAFHRAENNEAYLICDCDPDGFFSSAMMIDFCDKIGMNCIPLIHEGKIHGLDDEAIMQQIIKEPLPLVIIPDASGTPSQCKELLEAGVQDILILDHHQVIEYNPYATVINNQLDNQKVYNKALSGTGVTYKFIDAICFNEGIDVPYYLDLVAFSILSDVCDLRSLENHYYVTKGLENLNNKFLNELYMAFVTSDELTPEDVVWNIVPKLNAAIRSNDTELKAKILWLMSGNESAWDEINVLEVIKDLKKCHRQQSDFTRKAAEKLIAELDSKTKCNIIYTDEDLGAYTGLIAGKIEDITGKPTVLLREDSNDNHYAIGSCRSPIPLCTKMNNIRYVDWCRGHEEAFGVRCHKEDIAFIQEWSDGLDLDIEPEHEVVQVFNNGNIPAEVFGFGTEYKNLWGHGIPYPKYGITNVSIKAQDIQVIGRNKATIKFEYKGKDYIKFFCGQGVKDKLHIGENRKISLDIIGKLEYNVYNGNVNKQVIIEDFEVNEPKETSWEDIF